MSDAYQFRTLDRSADTDVIDRDETLPTQIFTPAAPRWIPPKTEATVREEREAIVRREADDFGRIRWGSAFFGWVSASGVGVLLAGALGGIGAVVELAFNGGSAQAAWRAATALGATGGLVGAIALGVVLFVAYLCGGYVAGRMARFAGARQGFAVWLWAVAFAVVGAAVAYFAGVTDPLGVARGLPGAPDDQGALALAGGIALVALAVLTVAGALLGGRLGMRYHRRVDFAGVDD